MESLFKYKCFEIGHAKLSEKVIVFMKYMLLKKFFFWQGSCSEQLPALKKCVVWKITCSEEKAPPKQYLCWKSIYL